MTVVIVVVSRNNDNLRSLERVVGDDSLADVGVVFDLGVTVQEE